MKQVQFALPEDLRQIVEEIDVEDLDFSISLLLAHSTHQLVNVDTCLVGIIPLTHLNSKFKLLFSDFKNLSNLLCLVQFDWERNPAVKLWFFVRLENLVKVGVKGL